MKIDIDKLTEAELIDPNNRIIQRLRLLHVPFYPEVPYQDVLRTVSTLELQPPIQR